MSYRIAIIGAGPGGLTLACILNRYSIVPAVFERDPSPDYRPQGGTLDLHTNSGQLALREAGLWDAFQKHARYDAQTMKILLKSADVIFQDEPDDNHGDTRPEIDRTALRHILLESFGAENVKWGHTLASVEPTPDGKHDLHFKEGKVETGFDLVVGAEGAWSRVRSLITSTTPSYSKVSLIELNISDPTGDRYDSLNDLVGQGSLMALNDRKALMCQRLGTGGLRIYVGFGMDEVGSDWLANEFDAKNIVESKAKALTYFQDWSPRLQDIIRLADENSLLLRPLYMLPVDHIWESRPGLTLLGDAAHLMTPFAGEGVNVTMGDAVELAKKIVEGIKTQDMNGAIKEYEANLFKRGSDAMKETERNKQAFFAANFPESMGQIMREIQGEGGDSKAQLR